MRALLGGGEATTDLHEKKRKYPGAWEDAMAPQPTTDS